VVPGAVAAAGAAARAAFEVVGACEDGVAILDVVVFGSESRLRVGGIEGHGSSIVAYESAVAPSLEYQYELKCDGACAPDQDHYF
jgi:hypothetical protein